MRSNLFVIVSIFERAIKMRYIIVILLVNLWVYQSLFWNTIVYQEIPDLFEVIFGVLNNRFVLILVHAIGYLFLYSKVVKELRYNEYIAIRMKSKMELQRYMHMLFATLTIGGMGISILMLGLIIITSGVQFVITKEWVIIGIVGLICSFLYYFMLGILYSVMDALFKRKGFVILSLTTILFLNIAISSNTAFSSWKMVKLTFIGNLIDISSNCWMNILYWIVLICILLHCERIIILTTKSAKAKLCSKYRTMFCVIVLSLLGFGILGVVSLVNHEIYVDNILGNLTQELMGFATVNQYMFMYLIYQLPILIFSFYKMTKRFSIYAFPYALRKGSIWRWQKQQLLEAANWIVIYYVVGIFVLCSINCLGGAKVQIDSLDYEVVQLADVVVQVINCVLQSVCILVTSFILWLLEKEEKNVGFICTLCWHLIATVLACEIPKLGYLLPLTQGQLNAQQSPLYALLYQCIWFCGIVLCTKKLLNNNQDVIIMRKMRG